MRMHKMRVCLPGISKRGQPETDIEACEWYGRDALHAGIELRGGRNRIEQSWNGDRQNECLSGVQAVA